MSKVLLLGGIGLIGSSFLGQQKDNFEIIAPEISEFDILDVESLKNGLEKNSPDWVLNLSGYTDVEKVEDQKGDTGAISFRLNAVGPKNLAEVCKEFGVPMVHVSTEYVFDGKKSGSPYKEGDERGPINWYGITKYYGEKYVLESGCELLLVRISMPFTAFYPEKSDIARTFLKLLADKQPIKALTDVRITPTLISDINNALKVLMENGARGIYHLATTTPLSPFDFVSEIAEQFDLDKDLISKTDLENYNNNKKAAMLQYSWLSPEKFVKEFGEGILHSVKDEVKKFKEGVDSLN